MAIHLPQGDLARVVSHEMDSSWPDVLEVVAYFGGNGRRGTRRSITISADQFFGRGDYNAPLTGDLLLRMIDQLRKQGPK